MSFYISEISRIKECCFSNDKQLDVVIRMRHYIANHYNKDLNLDLLSHVQFKSKFHLLRMFKRYYGQTPKQYLIDMRIAQAKNLLVNGISVTETCFDVWFDCPSSFSTLFKSRVGITPSGFQKRATFAKSV